MARPHIQVILSDHAVPANLRTALQRTDATAAFWPLSETLRGDFTTNADAVVVVVPENTSGLTGPLRVMFDRLAEHPRATLVLTPLGRPAAPLEHPPTVPVSYVANADEHDLTVRLTTMLEMRDSLDSLHRGLVANRRSGENVARRYVNQLRLASQVQRGFLPESLPRFGPVSFDAVFRPVDYVSGDIYDVHRLDEEHIGIALVDASGHGIPAALLTVYIKRSLRGKEIENGAYRILSPDEVLQRLNEDILDAQLSECPFIAAVYAVLNMRTLELSLARGGAPYPLLRTADGELEFLDSPGGVVGVLPDVRFEARTIQLTAGDSVVFYSDGLERIIAPHETGTEVPESLRRAASRIAGLNELVASAAQTAPAAVAVLPAGGGDGNGDSPVSPRTPIASSRRFAASRAGEAPTRAQDGTPTPSVCGSVMRSSWCATLRAEGPRAALEQASGRQRALRRMGYPLDDLTVLALQIDS